jgi:TetR/AcrR family transcriptional regulator, transcriptional repressor of aconitase
MLLAISTPLNPLTNRAGTLESTLYNRSIEGAATNMAGRGPRGANRSALLSAGYEAIATLGYRGATTNEICRRAGVSSGTFFHYFPTKEDLLLALLTETDPPSAQQSLTRVIDDVLALASDPLLPAFAREVSALTDLTRVAQTLTVEQQRRHRLITDAVEQERELGRIRSIDTETPVLRVEVILDGFESMLVTRPELDPGRLAEQVRNLIVDVLGWSEHTD